MEDDRALLIFIRNPRLGVGKRRIAATAGDARTLRIYRALLDHTRRVSSVVPATRYLYYSELVDTADEWPAADFRKALQPPGNDLGAKMQAAFAATLPRHPKVVIVGSDCAQLRPAHLSAAFAALDTHDAVLGPATDGGYYLLGLKDLAVDVFSNMTWSTDTVAAETLARLAAAGRSVAQLETLSDIDTEADWEKYGWALR